MARKIQADQKGFELKNQTEKGRRHGLVGPSDFWSEKREFQIRHLRASGLKTNHRLLDLGCGTLRGGIPIIKFLKEGHYTGIDVRHIVIEEARRELEEEALVHKTPNLLLVDALSNIQLVSKFNFVWAFSVLIHMTDEVLNEGLRFVESHLEDNGYFLANVNLGPRHDGIWKEFPLVWRPFEFYKERFHGHGLEIIETKKMSDIGHKTSHRNVLLVEAQYMLRARLIDQRRRGVPNV